MVVIKLPAHEQQLKTIMIRRITYLERMHSREKAEKRKLEMQVEKQRRTIQKLRAQVAKKRPIAMKTMLKKQR